MPGLVMLARIGLTPGRTAELTKLEIFATYGGMLEGHPCAPVNDRLLARELATDLEL